jgi:hypothetical protein
MSLTCAGTEKHGGVEAAFKEDKQGLGLTRRNKKRCAAQQMVLALGTLAHNVLVWARAWLVPYVPAVAHYGLLRLVRCAMSCMSVAPSSLIPRQGGCAASS